MNRIVRSGSKASRSLASAAAACKLWQVASPAPQIKPDVKVFVSSGFSTSDLLYAAQSEDANPRRGRALIRVATGLRRGARLAMKKDIRTASNVVPTFRNGSCILVYIRDRQRLQIYTVVGELEPLLPNQCSHSREYVAQ